MEEEEIQEDQPQEEIVEDNQPKEQPKEQHQEAPEAKRARLLRELERHDRKYPQAEVPKEPSSKTIPSSELDYGQKAFLLANGVKGSDEVELVKTIMSNTGKSLDDVVESKYFQSELKEMREARAVVDATPTGTKRSAQMASDSVDYWIAKGELPPADQRELRQKVVNARIKTEQSKSQFTDNPIVK
jgi:hypothetical protein